MRFPATSIVSILLLSVVITSSYSGTISGSDGNEDISSPGVFSFTPIVINGNNDLINQAATNGWQGNGTSGYPYLIEDLVIQTTTANGVYLSNTNLHILFRNCSLITAAPTAPGFKIQNSWNLRFENISTVYREELFEMSGCSNIQMEMIEVPKDSAYRWAWIYSCNDLTVSNSSLSSNMWVYYSRDILIDNVTGTGRYDAVNFMYSSGLTIKNSTFETMSPVDGQYSDDILIQNNVLNGSRLSEFNNCQGVKVVDNLNSSGSPYGFQFEYCSEILIRDNDLRGSSGTIEFTGTRDVEMYNNTLGSEGLVLSGSKSDLYSLMIPVNNTVNDDPILFMKDGNSTSMIENPVHSQLILLNMPGFSMTDRDYNWNPYPIQIFYSSEVSLIRITISNASRGISAHFSDGVLIEKCIFEDIQETAIDLQQCDGIRIDDCVIESVVMDEALILNRCNEFQILSTRIKMEFSEVMTITSSQNGNLRNLEMDITHGSITISSSYGISIEDCTIAGSVDLSFVSCSQVRIRENSISSNTHCLQMSNCGSVILEGNDLSTSSNLAILDQYCSGNRYYSNRMTNGGIGFNIRSTGIIDLEIPINNTLDGYPIFHMTDENKKTIDEEEKWGQIILNGVNSHTISELHIENMSYPLQLLASINIRLRRCYFSNTTFPVVAQFSYPLTISSCEFYNTSYSISGYDCAPFYVENCIFDRSLNTIVMEREFGDITLSPIRVRGCTMFNSSNQVVIEDAQDVDISECLFSGGSRGISLTYGARASIRDCTFNTVENYGAMIYRYMDNTIERNLFLNCTLGLSIDRSYGNTVRENLFIGSEDHAIVSEYSYNSENWFYHNVFIENNGAGETYNTSHPQAYCENNVDQWNNTYKRGNYWSDWTEPDINEDGVVDEQYPIPDRGNSDKYPLAHFPFKLIGPPQKLVGTPGNGYVLISWEPPIWNRLIGVEGYRIQREDSDGLVVEFEVGSDDLIFNDTTISNGRRYTYEITAKNLFDESHPSDPMSLVGDGSVPIFTSISPEMGSVFNETSVKLEWDCHDTGVGMGKVRISLDNEGWEPADSLDSHVLNDLEDGNHTVTVKAYDLIGNNAKISTSFVVDTQPPQIHIWSDFEGSLTNLSNATISWDAEDENSGIQYYMISVNGAIWEYWGTKEQYRFEDLITAQFNISVKAVDMAGNEVNKSVQFFCDIDPPIVFFEAPSPGSNFEGRSVQTSWSVKENGSGLSSIWLYFDGSRIADVTGMDGFWINDISPGPHLARLIIEDIAGNRATEIVDFTTGILPQISSISPKGSNVSLKPAISIDISKNISSIDIHVEDVNGTTVISGSSAFFEFDGLLDPLTNYTVVFSGFDLHNLPFGPFNWSFKTVRFARVIGKLIDPGNRSLVGVDIFVDGERSTPSDYTGSFELFLDKGFHKIDFHFDGYYNRTIEIRVTYGQNLDLENIVLDKEEESSGGIVSRATSRLGVVLGSVIVLGILIFLFVIVLIRKGKDTPVSDMDEAEDEIGEHNDVPVIDLLDPSRGMYFPGGENEM